MKRDKSKRKRQPWIQRVLAAHPDVVDLYSFSDVAELVDLPESTVKNWTFGRPLSIVPSIFSGGGKGSRSLYSLYDVWRFAIAKQLVEDGFAPAKLQEVVDQLTDDHMRRCVALEGTYRAMVVLRHMDTPDLLSVEYLPGLPDRSYFGRLYKRGVTGVYILDLELVVAGVDVRDAELQKRRQRRSKRIKLQRSLDKRSKKGD